MSDSQIPNHQGGVPPYPYYYERPKKRSSWWIPLLIIGIILVLIVAFFGVFFASIGSAFEKEQVVVKSNSVLYLNIDGINEFNNENPFEIFGGGSGKPTFFELLSAIRQAKDDDNIVGIYYPVKMNMGLSNTKAAELQDVLLDFKRSGKFIYSYIQVGSESQYFNALPSDKIFMPEEGMLEMNGFAINAMFFKNTLDKIGMDFYVQQFEDFKSAGESFSRTKFSDSARHQLSVILNHRYNNFVGAVAQHRRMNTDKVRSALATGYYTADSLLALGFIDEIKSEEEVKNMMKEKVFGGKNDNDKLNFINIGRYVSSDYFGNNGEVADENKRIAVIYAVGAINTGKQEGWSNENAVRSDDFISYLRQAREDKEVKAIIIRIDSPGGSVIASDDIYDEIIKTRKVKPVYASMSDVAASGGYYIAMACDSIIAHPTTITGSIGVILMINNFSGVMNKIGLTTDTITTGPAANFLSPMSPFKDADKAKLYSLSEKIYKRFVSKAAESRKKSFDEMRSLAKGRVWLGTDAKKHGLIDIEGGFLEALAVAKQRIGISRDEKVYINTYPSDEVKLKSILKIFGVENDDEPSVNVKAIAKAYGISATDFIGFWSLLPVEIRTQLLYNYQLVEMANKENALMALPYYHELK